MSSQKGRAMRCQNSAQKLTIVGMGVHVGVGGGRGRRGSAQASSRSGSSQIISTTALQITAQSGQSIQEQVGGTTGGITGGENGGGSQDASADDLQRSWSLALLAQLC